jgi:hypothetical protein
MDGLFLTISVDLRRDTRLFMTFPFSTLEVLTMMIPKEFGLSKSDLVYLTVYKKRRVWW